MKEPDRAECFGRHRDLIAVRQRDIVPLLDALEGNAGSFEVVGPGAVAVRWTIKDGRELRLYANLCDRGKENFPASEGRVLWHQGAPAEGTTMGPWTVRWTLKGV